MTRSSEGREKGAGRALRDASRRLLTRAVTRTACESCFTAFCVRMLLGFALFPRQQLRNKRSLQCMTVLSFLLPVSASWACVAVLPRRHNPLPPRRHVKHLGLLSSVLLHACKHLLRFLETAAPSPCFPEVLLCSTCPSDGGGGGGERAVACSHSREGRR